MGQTVGYTQYELDAERSRELANFEKQQPILKSFQKRTQIPHIHLRLCSSGYVELCGPDLDGNIEGFLKCTWLAQEAALVPRRVMPTGTCCWKSNGEANLPRETMDYTCDKHFVLGKQLPCGQVQGNGIFQAIRGQNESNIPKRALELINFMNECSCEVLSCSIENLHTGAQESQLTFRSPHQKNIVGPCIMVVMKQMGYIELIGSNTEGILDDLAGYLQNDLNCKGLAADVAFCDRRFKASFSCSSISSANSGDNNMGQRAAVIINFMAQTCRWSLVAHTESDLIGRCGTRRQRNLLFRQDSLGFHDHIIVELRNVGRIYLNGDPEAILQAGEHFASQGCQPCNLENLCGAQYIAPAGYFLVDEGTSNLSKCSVEIADWLSGKGWTLRSCGGVHYQNEVGAARHEQHLVFGRPERNHCAPWSTMAVEFRVIPNPVETDYTCIIEISGENTYGIYGKLLMHMTQMMQCEEVGPQAHCDLLLHCNALRVSGQESNFGRFSTMLCDFMADHLHEWTLVSSVGQSISNNWGDTTGSTPVLSFVARQQLFIFLSASPAPLQQSMGATPRGHTLEGSRTPCLSTPQGSRQNLSGSK